VIVSISSDGTRLSGHLARPPSPGPVPGVVLCHGIPHGPRGASNSAATYPELAERIARDAGWAALAFNFRGTGGSEGDFSVRGWLTDLAAAIDMLAAHASGVWLAGVAEGGTLAICAAARDPQVRGVATLGAPASLRRWSRDPAGLLDHARRVGMVRTPGFPPDAPAWARQVAGVDARAAAAQLPPRPLLVLHGSADDVVLAADARALAEAAAATVELRIVHAAGHRLRHDPRAVAALLGWLARQIT
jgi:uncharacterized protein